MPGIRRMPDMRSKPAMKSLPGMGEMGERAYAYAKACGIIGKSFVGKRTHTLEGVNGLAELDKTIFPAAVQNLPEKELLVDLENRIIGRAVNSITAIVGCFSSPPEFLTLLIRSYEYADLKSALIAALEREKEAPAHTDIGRFQTVRFDKWPDIRSMIEGTEYDFLLDKNGVLQNDLGSIALQTVLDQHYYGALWKALVALPKKDRFAAEKILSDEISLKNSGWALRLRTYYQMNQDEVKRHLVYMSAKSRSLAEDAVQCLEYPLDNLSAWSSWRWKDFLNPVMGDGYWQADPRYFQNGASGHLYNLARRYFRLHPFSLDTIFCFIKLKQFEEDLLTSDAEGLSMGMSGKDIFSMLKVES